MSIELFRKIIDEIEDNSFQVALNVASEPLLHPDIVEMVKIARKAGLRVYFGTSATQLTKEKSRELISSGLDELIISFDSEDKSEYERMRQGAKYEKVLKILGIFCKSRRTSDL